MKTWELLCIVSSSLVLALFHSPWVALSRSFKSTSPEMFLGIVSRMSQNMAPALIVLMPISLLSMIPILLYSHASNTVAFGFDLTALALNLLSLVVTVIFEVPIVTEVIAWTSSSLPTDWQQRRDRWIVVHMIRVLAGVVSLLSLIIAALI
jgi:hypothetical protein